MKKSDYSFVLLSALFITTPAFAQDATFAAPAATTTTPVTTTNSAIMTTPMTTTNPTSNLFSASPAATISPVTTATPFATTTPVTTTSPTTTTSSVTTTSPTITTTNPTSTLFSASPAATISPVTTATPFATTTPSISTSDAVEVSITGTGPAVDVAASSTVRQVIGQAVANGVIDRFIVLGYGVNGGFSACAQAAPTGQVENFNAVINQLNSIQPNPQTTAYSVQPVGSCTTDTAFCTQDAMQCPDGSFVSRLPPSCEFAQCPGT